MKLIETNFELENRTRIVESLEAALGVPREFWERKRSKRQDEVRIRHIYAYLLYKYGGYTLKQSANILGHKNHTTIIHSYRTVEEWLELPQMYKLENRIVKLFLEEYEQRNQIAD